MTTKTVKQLREEILAKMANKENQEKEAVLEMKRLKQEDSLNNKRNISKTWQNKHLQDQKKKGKWPISVSIEKTLIDQVDKLIEEETTPTKKPNRAEIIERGLNQYLNNPKDTTND
jgi:hypothetical protein